MTDTSTNTGQNASETAQGDPYRSAHKHLTRSVAETIDSLIATTVKVPDPVAARQVLTEFVGSAFKGEFGSQIVALQGKIARLKAEVERTEAERNTVTGELLQTPAWIPASRANHGRDAEDHVETPFRDWQVPDKIEAVLLLGLIILAGGASAMTAHANLVGSALPVFIENPLLPWTMAMLAPMAGFAIKTMWSHLRSEVLRKAFTYTLNTIAGLFIVLWVMLFADQFHGLSTGPLAGGLFDEPSWWDGAKETAFVAVTLATEILITAVLAHKLDKIAAQYAPNYWLENLEHKALSTHRAELDAKHQALSEALEEAEGELAALNSSLDRQVHLATLILDARRAVQSEPIL